jgi:hypothetical protein
VNGEHILARLSLALGGGRYASVSVVVAAGWRRHRTLAITGALPLPTYSRKQSFGPGSPAARQGPGEELQQSVVAVVPAAGDTDHPTWAEPGWCPSGAWRGYLIRASLPTRILALAKLDPAPLRSKMKKGAAWCGALLLLIMVMSGDHAREHCPFVPQVGFLPATRLDKLKQRARRHHVAVLGAPDQVQRRQHQYDVSTQFGHVGASVVLIMPLNASLSRLEA